MSKKIKARKKFMPPAGKPVNRAGTGVGAGHGSNTVTFPAIEEVPTHPRIAFEMQRADVLHSYVMGNKISVLVSWDTLNGWIMSVAHKERYPTWDEIAHIRYTLADSLNMPKDICFAMLLPPPSAYINIHNFCFICREIDPDHNPPSVPKEPTPEPESDLYCVVSDTLANEILEAGGKVWLNYPGLPRFQLRDHIDRYDEDRYYVSIKDERGISRNPVFYSKSKYLPALPPPVMIDRERPAYMVDGDTAYLIVHKTKGRVWTDRQLSQDNLVVEIGTIEGSTGCMVRTVSIDEPFVCFTFYADVDPGY